MRGHILQEVINIWFSFKSYNIGLFDKTNIFYITIINTSSER